MKILRMASWLRKPQNLYVYGTMARFFWVHDSLITIHLCLTCHCFWAVLTNTSFFRNASWTLKTPFVCFSYKTAIMHRYTKTSNSMYTPSFSVFFLVFCFLLLTSLAYIYEHTSFILIYHVLLWLASFAILSAFITNPSKISYFPFVWFLLWNWTPKYQYSLPNIPACILHQNSGVRL